jgi:hypothetical protein
MSPITVNLPEPEKKRGRSSFMKRELKVVVDDFRRTSGAAESSQTEASASTANGHLGASVM